MLTLKIAVYLFSAFSLAIPLVIQVAKIWNKIIAEDRKLLIKGYNRAPYSQGRLIFLIWLTNERARYC